MKFAKLLENKYVLYFVFLLSMLHIISYMIKGENDKVALFILIGIISSRFSKNMTVVLGVPLIGTHVYSLSTGRHPFFEGFTPGSSGSTAAVAAVKADIKQNQATRQAEIPSSADSADTLMDSSTETAAAPQTDSMSLYKKNKRVDYAATLEDSYGDLNKILDGNGIKNLTNDTKRLMEQQQNLAGALKSMTPLISQAQNMLKGFDIKGLSNVAKSMNSNIS